MATASTAEAVAGEIRAEVARQRLTWRTLAQTTDITPSTLSRRMADPASLSLGELLAICSALDIAPRELLALAEPSYHPPARRTRPGGVARLPPEHPAWARPLNAPGRA